MRWTNGRANSPPPSTPEVYARVAADALAEAERGHMRLLVELLDPNLQYNNPEPGERPVRSYLPPAAWQFLLTCLPAYESRSRAGARKTATARSSASAAHPKRMLTWIRNSPR